MYIELHRSSVNGQFWFVLKSLGNHRILANSEMYDRKAGALNAVQIISSTVNPQFIDLTL